MHLVELLIRKNQLSGRRSITPLGIVVIGIALVFVGALLVGWFRQITRNVNALDVNPIVLSAQNAQAAVLATPTAGPATSNNPGWTMQTVHTPLGIDMVTAPPEVTAAVLHDYDAAIHAWDAHKFDLAYLEQHAPDFFNGKQLARMQALLPWLKQENRTVALGGYTRLPIGRSVQYAPDGVNAFVIDYIAAGKTYDYDLTTRAPIDEQTLPDRIVMTELSYDTAAKRWKISRLALSMDLQTKQVLWQDR